jgi:hypothetical protein
MKYTFLILFIVTSAMFGCKKSDSPAVDNTPQPAKIELTTDKPVTSDRTIIKAYGLEEAVFKTKVTDKDGNILNIVPKITLSGSDYNGNSFRTDKPGYYEFQASIGSLMSNTHEITAREIAEKYVEFTGIPTIKSISPTGLLTISVPFKNISGEVLRNVAFVVECLNSAGEVIKENNSTRTSALFGTREPTAPHSSAISDSEVGYFPGTKSIIVKLYGVTMPSRVMIYASVIPDGAPNPF